jgi:hypothetical protein
VIPRPHLTAWAPNAPWPNPDQVEQDLLLSRLIIEIANDEYLGNELVFRGGTCLHKLRLPRPMRYSEDLDYVRRSDGGIGDLIGALRSIGERLEMKVTYQITRHPKVRFIGLTAALAIENLTATLGKPEFRSDLDPLTTSPPTDYDIDNAAGLIVEAVLRRP